MSSNPYRNMSVGDRQGAVFGKFFESQIGWEREDVKKALRAFVSETSHEEAMRVLASLGGVTALSRLNPSKFGDVISFIAMFLLMDDAGPPGFEEGDSHGKH